MTNTNEELKKIQIEDDVDRVELFGNMDANLGLIQESTGVEIFQRDDCLLLRGDKLELAEGILKELMDIIRVGENWMFRRSTISSASRSRVYLIERTM